MRALIPFLLAACLVSARPAQAQTQAASEFPRFYFDLGNYTETWLELTPAPRPGETTSACVLNVTVRYRGKPVEGRLASPPQAIVVRAESNPLYNPRIVRHAAFQISADGVAAWDSNLALQFFSSGAPCEDCAVTADTVEVTIAADALEMIAAARRIEGNAMGLPFTLSGPQIDTLKRFVESVLGPER